MTGEISAADDALTGGILAGAVEKETNPGAAGHGGPEKGGGHHGPCPNCGAALTGAYCASCGQAAHLHRTLHSLGHDILHGVFHFDGKIWRTLPELFFRPGALTRRYINGERAKFVSPMALFLFSVFLMFSAFSFTGGAFLSGDHKARPDNVLEQARQLNAGIMAAHQALADPGLTGEQREGAQERLDQLTKQRHHLVSGADPTDWRTNVALEAVKQQGQVDELRVELDRSGLPPTRKAALEKKLVSLEAGSKGTDAIAKGDWAKLTDQVDAPGNHGVHTGWTALDNKLTEGIKGSGKNRELLAYKLKAEGYKFSWALIPISLPFVWLLFFWRRDLPVYDHAIFTTYSLCFMMLLTVVLSLLTVAGVNGVAIAATAALIPPLHIYKQLRGTYALGRVGALVRLCFLLVFIVFIVTIFALGLLAMGVLG